MNLTVVVTSACIFASLGVVWRASDRVIAHALRLANHYKVSTFFVGFVVLALAANIPDLAITALAAFQGVGQLAAGDIIGACFNDVALITGGTLIVARSVPMTKRESDGFLRLILSSALVLAGAFCVGPLTVWHGVVLVSFYAAFLMWAWRHRHEHSLLEVTKDDLTHTTFLSRRELWVVWGKVVGALILVLGGSSAAIQCGVLLAQSYGLSLESIGATIIALGTSLPEISMGFHAYRRNQYTLALGPTIGTIFSQSTFVLGMLALLSRQPIDLAALQGAAVFMFISFVVIGTSIVLKQMGRVTGFMLMGLFVLYVLHHIVMF